MRIGKVSAFAAIIPLLIIVLTTNQIVAAQEQPQSDIEPSLLGLNPVPNPDDLDALAAKVSATGEVRVIVELALPVEFKPEGGLGSGFAVDQQRQNIEQAQESLLGELAAYNATAYATYDALPAMAIKVDAAGLDALLNSPLVAHVQEDVAVPPTLASSTAVIGAPTVWAAGYDGTGQAVVILDTGIDGDHTFFDGGTRVVAEACFSNAGGAGGNVSLCPSGAPTQTGSGAAEVDGLATCLNGGSQLCNHGTHVAGIAAGNGASFDGVARNANIIAIQVFTRFNAAADCNGSAPCVLSYTSDQLSALNYVYNTLRHSYSIASVNMSLGGGSTATHCDSDSRKAAIDNLISAGIATIIANGNDGFTSTIGAPACISTAISVGSTTDADAVSSFSNVATIMDVFAPGSSINSSIVGGGFANFNGTSMATPHVAGAWAVLKQISPSATVTDVLDALTSTGVSVTDSRTGGSVTKPRIQLDAALAQFNPNTWTGATDTDWHTAGNWSSGTVPILTEKVIIPGSLTNYPIITAAAASQSLIVQDGASVTMNSGTLTVSGVWDEQGTGVFNGTDGTVIFASSISQGITQTASSNFHHVQIGDGATSNQVSPNTALDVNGNLTIKSGVTLNGGSQTINLAGNWYDEGNGFAPSTSTVVFDGATQTADKVTTSTLLNEPFDEADGDPCCSNTHLPSGWVREQAIGFGFLAGDITGSNGEAVRINDATNPSPDAWLFTTAVELEVGVTYQISYDYRHLFSNTVVDVVTLYIGSSQSSGSMSTQISTSGNFTGNTYSNQVDSFTVGSSGTYFIGIRAQEVSGQDHVAVDDIILTGTKGLTFNNLQVNSSGSTTFNQDVQVQNNLTTNSGGTANFADKAVTVEGTVANNGTLQAVKDAPTSTNTTFLMITDAAATSTKFRGAEINPAGNMGSTTVQIRGNQDCTSNAADPLTHRCFDISPTTSQSATVRYWFTAAELNGQDPSSMTVWHYDGGSSWSEASSTSTYNRSETDATCDSVDGNQCWVEALAVTTYSPFGAGSASAPTLVTLSQQGAAPSQSSTFIVLVGLLLLAVSGVILWRRQA